MTHFSVLVIGKATSLTEARVVIKNLLAPYNENMEVNPYKDYMSHRHIIWMRESYITHIKINHKRTEEDYEELFAELTEEDIQILIPDLQAYMGKIGGYDEKGLFTWSTYNPDSKWDWNIIGGRFSGMLAVKELVPRHEYIIGRPGAFKNETGIDLAFAKDIDWKKIEEQRFEVFVKAYIRLHKEMYKLYKDGRLDDKNLKFYKFICGVEDAEIIEDQSLFNYMKDIKTTMQNVPIVTYSVLDADGWHERAESGMFGSEHDVTEDKETWDRQFWSRWIKTLEDDDFIAIVDCHI